MAGEPEIHAHCSWCFQKTQHTRNGINHLGRGVFACGNCGQRTLACTVPSCFEMARGEGKVDDLFCAAHDGRIPGFQKLSINLSAIEDYQNLFKREVKNFGKAAKIGAVATGVGLVVAPLALVSAPYIGGALGVKFGLSGAAATSKGLATLGFGSLKAGGLGMAGGIKVVTCSGAALGGTMSGVVANAYWGDITGFKIKRLKKGRGPAVLVINGWLTESVDSTVLDWLEILGEHYGPNPWYLVEWENKRLREIAKLSLDASAQATALAALAQLAKRASKKATGPLAIAQTPILAMKFAKNPWSVALSKTAQTGSLLADIISRTPVQKRFILMGHSLGAKVAVHCLQSLGEQPRPRVKTAHLLGGAFGTGEAADWKPVVAAIEGKIHNYYSKNDEVLGTAYKVGRGFLGSPPAGRNRIRWQPKRIANHDVTKWVGSHNDYKREAVEFLVK